MQYLADLLKITVDKKIITLDDLYTVEDIVIDKLQKDEELNDMWNEFINFSQIFTGNEKPNKGYWVNIPAKKRYISFHGKNL